MRVVFEKVLINGTEYTINPDGVQRGNISLYNVTPYLQVGESILQGSVAYPSVTLTVPSVPYPPPLENITINNLNQQTFIFRNRVWVLTATVEGGRLKIGTSDILTSWTITGVDTSEIEFSSG